MQPVCAWSGAAIKRRGAELTSSNRIFFTVSSKLKLPQRKTESQRYSSTLNKVDRKTRSDLVLRNEWRAGNGRLVCSLRLE